MWLKLLSFGYLCIIHALAGSGVYYWQHRASQLNRFPEPKHSLFITECLSHVGPENYKGCACIEDSLSVLDSENDQVKALSFLVEHCGLSQKQP
jgi:hypothetical protein